MPPRPLLRILVLVPCAALQSALAGPAPVQVTYSAEGECPGPSAFLDDLYSRTHNVRPSVEGDNAWRVRVAVRAEASRASGIVQIDGGNGMTSSREVEGESCREVVAALALVAALAIDSGAEAPQRCPAPKRAEAAPKLPEVGIRNEPVEPDSSGRTGRQVGDWSMGAHALMMGGIAPTILPGGSIHVAYEPESRGMFDARLRASVSHVPSAVVDSPGGEARFGWTAVRLEVCPAAVSFEGGALLGCATAGGGRTSAEAVKDSGKQTSNPWIDVGVSAHFKLDLARWLVVDAQAAMIAPLARHTFVFDAPTVEVYRTPATAGLFELGLAVRFP